MSRKWSDIDARRRDGIAAAFEVVMALDDLSHDVVEGPPVERVTFRDLAGWVMGPAVAMPPAQKRALLASPALRRDFGHLLARTAEWRCPRAAAASSGRLETREGTDIRLRMKPSRGAEGQVYVLVEFIGGVHGRQPRTLLVGGPDGDCARTDLPDQRDGCTQILVDECTEIVRLLRDAKTEIYLW